MKYYTYIIRSSSTDSYYIGSTENLQNRLRIHNEGGYIGSSTKKANDWKVYFYIECSSRSQAENIEKHIKRMRTRIYYRNLTIYPEMSEKLLERYK